jgi:hypothetical protein
MIGRADASPGPDVQAAPYRLRLHPVSALASRGDRRRAGATCHDLPHMRGHWGKWIVIDPPFSGAIYRPRTGREPMAPVKSGVSSGKGP